MNDSKNPLGARKDRHACLGEGCIGLEALKRVATHPALHHLPMILRPPMSCRATPEKSSSSGRHDVSSSIHHGEARVRK